MAVQIDATQPRDIGGQTAREILQGVVNVRTAGAREVAARLEEIARAAGRDATPLLNRACSRASRRLREAYKGNINKVTDNLYKSVRTQGPQKNYPGVGMAITGPKVTGPVGASPDEGSGNHAWLVEFGTGPRKPGSQGRRTYLNVHQSINGKMRRMSGTFNNDQFEQMGRGYYFLMGSKNEPTRQKKAGIGYPHDFLPDGKGGIRPFFLRPGETLKPMPELKPMRKAIEETGTQTLQDLINELNVEIGRLL